MCGNLSRSFVSKFQVLQEINQLLWIAVPTFFTGFLSVANLSPRCKFINCSSDSDDSGRTISDTENMHSRPCPCVSSRGRLLNSTSKLFQMPNATDAPAGEGTFAYKQKQPKKRRLNAITRERSIPRIPVGTDDRSNDATIPSTRKRRDGFDSEVGGSAPSEPTCVAGQASGVNAVGTQTDMVVPFS
ncbi:hypothetical protein CTI12_AA058130 [Artemisia annua]|uniref:Uncharacterized protein n=1 Tax=Artemisia annua TaxID=35608 RepID=A0A2U1Q9N4_ARTAN|nr:hypothetical protein CTI12_AA058130 [Artemisia annua]